MANEIVVPEEGRQTEETSASDLIGVDSNAFAIIFATRQMLKKAGASKPFMDGYRVLAMSGDYNHLLALSMAYLDADPIERVDE
jgi:hypothetical protein